MEENIDKLWADYLNREPLSEQDLQKLQEWMQASPKNQEFGEFICIMGHSGFLCSNCDSIGGHLYFYGL